MKPKLLELTDKDGFLIHWQPPHFFECYEVSGRAALRCVWCKAIVFLNGDTQLSFLHFDEFRNPYEVD